VFRYHGRGTSGRVPSFAEIAVEIDPHELAAQLLVGDLDDKPPDVQRLMRYVWARVGLDYGILLLVGQDHADGFDRLVCTLQEDGSCYIVERPPAWGLDEEASYVAEVKALLDEWGP
jgi:hypothetical protein